MSTLLAAFVATTPSRTASVSAERATAITWRMVREFVTPLATEVAAGLGLITQALNETSAAVGGVLSAEAADTAKKDGKSLGESISEGIRTGLEATPAIGPLLRAFGLLQEEAEDAGEEAGQALARAQWEEYARTTRDAQQMIVEAQRQTEETLGERWTAIGLAHGGFYASKFVAGFDEILDAAEQLAENLAGTLQRGLSTDFLNLNDAARGRGSAAGLRDPGLVSPIPQGIAFRRGGGPSDHVAGGRGSGPFSTNAIDVHAVPGTPVLSPIDGEVVDLGGRPPELGTVVTGSGAVTFGRSVTIRGTLPDGQPVTLFFTHLDDIVVKQNASVAQNSSLCSAAAFVMSAVSSRIAAYAAAAFCASESLSPWRAMPFA